MREPRSWHIAEADGQVVEATEQTVRRRVIDGTIGPETLVWTPGMRGWQPAADVLPPFVPAAQFDDGRAEPTDLSGPPPLPTAPAPALATPEPDEGDGRQNGPAAGAPAYQPGAGRWTGVIGRHWRGELPLWASFFICGVVVSLLMFVARHNLAAVQLPGRPRLMAAVDIAATLAAAAVTLWQLAGIWRSAGRARDHCRRTGALPWWPTLARALTLLGFLAFIIVAGGQSIPQIAADIRVATGNVPPHELRLLNNDTELALSGGIDGGTFDEFRLLTIAYPQLRTIDLDSVGGSLIEARQIHDLIRKRHLATYTDKRCFSACTVVFLAGEARYLGPHAVLGFRPYDSSEAGLFDGQEINAWAEQDLVKSGVAGAFAHRAFAPGTTLWQPDHATLLAAHVATQKTAGLRFAAAASGFGLDTRAGVERFLTLDDNAFQALKRVDPTTFYGIVDTIVAGTRGGRTLDDVLGLAFDPLNEVIEKYSRVAEDAIQVRIADYVAEQLPYLKDKQPGACIVLMRHIGRQLLSHGLDLPAPLARREIALGRDIVDSGATHPATATDTEQSARGKLARIEPALQASGLTLSTLASPADTDEARRAYCDAAAIMMTEVAKLPPAQAGPLMRYLIRL